MALDFRALQARHNDGLYNPCTDTVSDPESAPLTPEALSPTPEDGVD
ncbi:hypothetical protein [Halobaculum marinum]|uniref:Uncharacterized protein n=1 Tax=Halobaculum marinum TaxID=3031996 RepID=A0ABD5X040_9EURY|nr:hypothetical protein [Halobaculum sp. DT55]